MNKSTKKITELKLNKRLISYSSLVVALSGFSDTNGQIIYTDVNPDFGGADQLYELNMNNSGDVEFAVIHSSSSNLLYFGANPSLNNNSFMGLAGGLYNYPFALNSGDVINSGVTDWINTSSSNLLNYNSCQGSNSQWCDVNDKYLGLRFEIGGNIHYGWARLDVGNNASDWVIKDYAYNSVPNEEILAGEGILGIDDTNFKNFSYFVDASNFLQLKSNLQLDRISIYNISGQEIVAKQLSSSESSINLSNLQQGVYIAKVSIEGQSKSFKIIKK